MRLVKGGYFCLLDTFCRIKKFQFLTNVKNFPLLLEMDFLFYQTLLSINSLQNIRFNA